MGKVYSWYLRQGMLIYLYHHRSTLRTTFMPVLHLVALSNLVSVGNWESMLLQSEFSYSCGNIHAQLGSAIQASRPFMLTLVSTSKDRATNVIDLFFSFRVIGNFVIYVARMFGCYPSS